MATSLPAALPRPRVAGIHVSGGGVPKRPVASARIAASGLEGDRQRDLRFHGGPARAVCLFSASAPAPRAPAGSRTARGGAPTGS